MNMRLITAVLTLVMLSMFAACNSGGGGGGGSHLTAQPLYPINGADWNDYVSSSTGTATDTACNAATDTACLHAGEARVVEVTGKTSCTGLTASDALGAFDWMCDESTGTARFISTGLKAGKYLSDLIDFDVPKWKANSVNVYDGGTPYYSSPEEVWWSNPIAVDNDGGSLNQAGTIYVVTNDALNAGTGGYVINASSVGLVAKPGVTINGPAQGAGSYVIAADGSGTPRDHLWIEGSVDAQGDDIGIRLSSVRFSVLRNVAANNADTGGYKYGISLWSSTHNRLVKISAAHNSNTGIYFTLSSNNTLADAGVVQNSGYGLRFSQSSNNTLSSVKAVNNGTGLQCSSSSGNMIYWISAVLNTWGIVLDSSPNNTINGISAENNASSGVMLIASSSNRLRNVVASSNTTGLQVSSSSNNTIAEISAANNTNGVYLAVSSNNTLSEVVATNNGTGIFFDSNANTNVISDIASANNSIGIELYSASNNKFTNLLKVGNTTNCYVTGGTNPGLVNGTCANNGTSDASLTTSVTLSTSFVGKVAADDTVNTSDASGAAAYPANPALFDWTNFDNGYRGWGRDGTFGNVDSRGQWTTGTGRIWDWSLKNSDAVIKGVSSLPTGGQTLTHTWSDATTTTFLRHAVEISGDGIGNDNLLCESSESCLYTPNIGAYQGHGSLIDAGTIGTGGTIENVVLKKYTTNGY